MLSSVFLQRLLNGEITHIDLGLIEGLGRNLALFIPYFSGDELSEKLPNHRTDMSRRIFYYRY